MFWLSSAKNQPWFFGFVLLLKNIFFNYLHPYFKCAGSKLVHEIMVHLAHHCL